MDLNERLNIITDNLENYYLYNTIPNYDNVQNFAFDIEACYLKEKNEMLTYSIALMSCDNDSDICYHYKSVDKFMNDLLSIKKKTINLFAHNALYDIKPFLLWFTEQDNVRQRVDEYFEKQCYDFYNKKKEKLKFTGKNKTKLKPFEYNLVMKDGVFYKLTLQGDDVTINFYDTFKIAPYSLQKCCDDFLKLHLPKDGLDYDKERSLNEDLTMEELSYIYNDVFGLSYLVKMLKIDGLDINGKHVVYTKLTNSGQSLEDYKETVLEDYTLKQNMFKNQDLYDYVDNGLMRSKFFQTNKPSLKKQIIFECLFPKQSYFTDAWQRHSYYGGLSTVCFENVEKFKKYKNHNGIVLDVNSLYPYIMSDRLLPYGQANYKDIPYNKMNESYKKCFPLYIQEITIYDFEVKENKMAFLQVKDNPNFNGREILKNNLKDGEKVTLSFRLCNPLLDLLFECYNVYSYELGGHMAFTGSHDLFKNYIDFWSEVKKNSTGANRAIAKLRQNGLYGKFGMSGSNEIT
ncbi:MAG: DNA polymerase, partial [Clostridia bacterium]